MTHYDVVAVGAGPANLSLAALLQTHTDRSIALFDRAPASRWHESLLNSGARMQTSWLKDLVSMVDPTHRLTFLNYLVTEGRLFALLNAQFDFIPRAEYMRYLAWAAERINGIHYDAPVDTVDFVEGVGFVTISRGEVVGTSDHLVLGVGTRSTLPPQFEAAAGDRLFVADHLAAHLPAMSADLDAPVAVVGGGQTGLEAVLRLRGAGFRDIRWLGRRQWFMTIDDSPVANEFYRPAHQQFLQQLSLPTRRRLVEEQNPTGDALTPGALRTLYHTNYDGMLELGRFPITLLPARDVVTAGLHGYGIALTAVTPETTEEHIASYVVVAAGREVAPVPIAARLQERLDTDDSGEMIIEPDYSVRWKGPDTHRIYAMNRARFTHGIPDANLTLLAVRSALVINSLLERQLFTVEDELCPVRWS